MSSTKNLTITLNDEEHAELAFLVKHFQSQSISNVSRSDVVKFMIKQMKKQVEQDMVLKVNALLEESENNKA